MFFAFQAIPLQAALWVFCFHHVDSPSCMYSRLTIVLPFPKKTFISSIRHIYILGFGQYWTLLWIESSSIPACLLYDFYSADRGFASGFLQIPPRGGHPCIWLTVPTAKPVADFYRLVIDHAGAQLKGLSPVEYRLQSLRVA